MASEVIDIVRADVTAEVSRALIAALNAELNGVYSEPGATHFRLDPEEVADGRGAFLVVYRDGTPVGCGSLRLLNRQADDDTSSPSSNPPPNPLPSREGGTIRTAELKRMYLSPAERGKGLGRRLVAALEAEARALGIQRLVLETGTRQAAALALYRATGFQPIPRYGEYRRSPETSVCMGKDLERFTIVHTEAAGRAKDETADQR